MHLKILRPKEELDEGYETPEHVSQTAKAPGLGLQHLITFIYQQSKKITITVDFPRFPPI